LLKELNMSHCSDEFGIFIDYSIFCIKAVLLHTRNVLSSIPVAHAFGVKKAMVA
jgi:hypothetical protein